MVKRKSRRRRQLKMNPFEKPVTRGKCLEEKIIYSIYKKKRRAKEYG